MALADQVPTKAIKVGQTLTLGTTLTGNRWVEVSLANLPEYLDGSKGPARALVTEFEIKLVATFTTAAGDPSLYSVYLHNALDVEIYGPGGTRIVSRRGWHDALWSAFMDGRVQGVRPADLPATDVGTGSYPRTLTKHIRFVDDLMSSRLARAYPAVAFKNGGRMRINLHAAAEAIKGVTALGISAATIDIYAHCVDVPASMVPIPAFVEETSVDSVRDVNPSPGPGMYLRCALVQSPQFATTADDLSLISNIDSFGAPGQSIKTDEPTDLILRRFHNEVTDPIEPQPPAAPGAGNKVEFRFLDPLSSADGKTRLIPLIYPRRGQDISGSPRFRANPVLRTNNNVMPYASVDFLIQRVQPRPASMLQAIQDALRARRTRPMPAPGYLVNGRMAPGIDPAYVPYVVSAGQ